VWVPQSLAFVGAWSWRFLLGVAAVAVLGWFALQAFVVVVPVLLAAFLAAGLTPAVDWLRRHRVPSGLAGVLVFVGFIGLVGALAFWLTVRLRGQFDLLGTGVRAGTERIKDWLVTGPLALSRERVEQAEFDLLTTFGGIDAGGSGLTRQLLGRVRLAAEVLGGLALLLFVLFFLLKDGRRMGDWLMERTPPRFRDDASAVVRAVRRVAQQVLVGMTLIGLADALLMGLALVVIGVPLVLPLVVLTFVGGFFPVIGATAAAAAAVLVSLVTGGPGDALLVAAAALAVQQVDGNLLQPLIMGSAVRLHPMVTAVAVSTGLVLGGLLGAFLAVPLVASGTRIAHHYRTQDR